jgi:hypothetical protein
MASRSAIVLVALWLAVMRTDDVGAREHHLRLVTGSERRQVRRQRFLEI